MLTMSETICESIFKGSRFDNDRLIHTSVHVKNPFYFIRSEDVAFPKYYEDHDNLITAVNIKDNLDGDASAEIDYGGVGYTYLNVHLRSALWGGYNFTIDIYGVKIEEELFT